MSSLREALEAALVEDPDDLATHSAYADHLMEQGDPRGELIQVQLALEDESLTREDRARLKKRERSLLWHLGPACLGEELSGVLSRRGCAQVIERGWLTSLDVHGL